MSEPTHGGGQGTQPKYFYFVDDDKYEWASPTITGQEIKANMKGGFNPGYQLFLESSGTAPDQPVQDATSISLERPGQGEAHLYTVAPATFGHR